MSSVSLTKSIYSTPIFFGSKKVKTLTIKIARRIPYKWTSLAMKVKVKKQNHLSSRYNLSCIVNEEDLREEQILKEEGTQIMYCPFYEC